MDTEDAFADEIAAIFAEEVEEVVQQINRYLPEWHAELKNLHALKEIRRAFHTLKGSGRMVQANQIAELAWAIENMLNRVLDASLPANELMVELVEQVSQSIPQLLRAFKKKQAAALAGINLALFVEQADALREGKNVAPLHGFSRPQSEQLSDEIIAPALPQLAQEEWELMNERITALLAKIDDLRRDWVTITTQVEAMRININSFSSQSISEQVNQHLQQADREIRELKYFVKTSSEKLSANAADTQKRLTERVDRDLQILQATVADFKADILDQQKRLRVDINHNIKLWALGCSICFSVMVLVASIFIG